MKYLFYLLAAIAAVIGATFLRPRLTASQRQMVAYAWALSFLAALFLIVAAIILMYVHLNLLRTIGPILLGVLVCLALFIMLGFSIGWEYLITQPMRQSQNRTTLAKLLDIDYQPYVETPSQARPLEIAILLIGGAFAIFVACLPIPATFYARGVPLCLGITCILFGCTTLLRRRVPQLERWASYLAIYILFPLIIYFGIRQAIEMLLAQ